MSILDTYDDLITNNTRRIELLEQSARLLFEEWFVRLRYPGHEHDKIINGVPEGWETEDFRRRCADIRRKLIQTRTCRTRSRTSISHR